jgi:hypothetical protein
MTIKKKTLAIITILLLTILASIVIGSTIRFAEETYTTYTQSGGTVVYATATPSPSPSPSPLPSASPEPTIAPSQHNITFTYDKIVSLTADTQQSFRGPRPYIETVSVPITINSNFNITFYARNFTLPVTMTITTYDSVGNATYENFMQIGLFSRTAKYNNTIISDTDPINVIAGQQTAFTLTFDFYNYYYFFNNQLSIGALNLNNIPYYTAVYIDFAYNMVASNT